MEHRAVLDIDAVADRYRVYVASEHSAEPDAAFIAHRHIAYHYGIFCDEAVAAFLRGETPYRFPDHLSEF